MRVGIPLMKYVLASLAKSVLISLGLTAAVSPTGEAVQKKTYRSRMTTLII